MRDSTKNNGEQSVARGALAPVSLELFSDIEVAEPERLRPFVRWAGGKTRLLRFISPHIPPAIRSYHEPFLGSGAVFFSIRGRITRNAHLSDLNDELINAWLVARDHPDAFLRAIRKYLGKDTEAEFYSVREATVPTDRIHRAARFLYLNQTAWNSLWRENKHGVFNVPWGARAFRGLEKASLVAVSKALQDVEICKQDWRVSLKQARKGDFVYLDPPYLPVSDTSKFSGYNGTRFRATDLAELASECEALNRRGVRWMLSNRDTPMVRELFSHSKIIAFTTRRSVAAQNKRNVQPADSPEVIVLGGANE